MSHSAMKNSGNIDPLSAEMLKESIGQLQTVYEHVTDLQNKYKRQSTQLRDVIMSNGALRSALDDALDEKARLATGSESTEAQFDLSTTIAQACSSKIKEYETEATLAWRLLKQYHNGVMQAMQIGQNSILNGQKPDDITRNIQRKLDEVSLCVATRIKLDSHNKEALAVAQLLDPAASKLSHEQKQNDETMG